MTELLTAGCVRLSIPGLLCEAAEATWGEDPASLPPPTTLQPLCSSDICATMRYKEGLGGQTTRTWERGSGGTSVLGEPHTCSRTEHLLLGVGSSAVPSQP